MNGQKCLDADLRHYHGKCSEITLQWANCQQVSHSRWGTKAHSTLHLKNNRNPSLCPEASEAQNREVPAGCNFSGHSDLHPLTGLLPWTLFIFSPRLTIVSSFDHIHTVEHHSHWKKGRKQHGSYWFYLALCKQYWVFPRAEVGLYLFLFSQNRDDAQGLSLGSDLVQLLITFIHSHLFWIPTINICQIPSSVLGLSTLDPQVPLTPY